MTEKYRIESGPFVGQVDVADGVIVAAPNVWRKFVGQPLHHLVWWLAKCNGSCSPVRIPSEDHEVERKHWEDGLPALNAANSVSTVIDETLSDVVLPTYCGCSELLQNVQQLETHVERGCWRKA